MTHPQRRYVACLCGAQQPRTNEPLPVKCWNCGRSRTTGSREANRHGTSNPILRQDSKSKQISDKVKQMSRHKVKSEPMGKLQRMMRQAAIDEANEPLVNEFAANHGDYREHAEFGDARNAKVNRGGTAIERWLNESPSTLFNEPERAAVRYCQRLWQRIDKKGPPEPGRVPGDVWIGQSEHDALAALAVLKKRFPLAWWSAFENCCRFDMDAPTAGARLATNSRTASDAAKLATAFVAGMIAQWEGL